MKEAFLYLWVNLTNKKRYLGYHKGPENDTYMCSANEDFFNDYYSADIVKRRVIARGTHAEMIQLEYKLLKKVDARRNPKYYNKSNGGIIPEGLQMKTNFTLIKEIAGSLSKRETYEESTKDVFALERYQTRDIRVNNKKVGEIAEKIEAYGTKGMSPIVVVNMGDRRILLDGNHTIHAAKRAKVPSVQVVEIDISELENNELNTIALGNHLNHVTIIKTAPDNPSIKATLRKARELGEDITNRLYKQELGEATGRSIKSIARLVANVLEEEELVTSVFRTWEKDELQSEKMKLQDKYTDSIVMTAASGGAMTTRAIGELLGRMSTEDSNSGILVYHHSKPKWHAEFDRKKVDALVKKFNLNITIVELATV